VCGGKLLNGVGVEDSTRCWLEVMEHWLAIGDIEEEVHPGERL
jgi:hypothetical protein